jgi:murein L,D-transpeptidase YcbB/YkuD
VKKKPLMGAIAICFIAGTALLGGGVAQAAPSTASSSDIAASEAAAAKASPAGDEAALKAAKQFSAASLLYCNDHWAYWTPSNDEYSYIPQYETNPRATNKCYLEQGTSGNGVVTLQNSLKQCYGKSITVDGQFGPATYNALLQVQRQVGVTIDGVYGPGTGKAMKHGGTICRKVPASAWNN